MNEMTLIDFDDYQAIGFDVILDEGEYNLHFVFFHLNEENKPEDCLVYRTTVFTETIQQMGEKIKAILSIGMFDNLSTIAGGHILNEEFELIEKVNWNDYISVVDVLSSFTPESQKFLH